MAATSIVVVTSSRDWLCEETQCFVVPRAKARAPRGGEPYEKRGLLHHRIIPRTIEGLTVEVVLCQTGRAFTELTAGAALFDTLELCVDPAHQTEKFTITGIGTPDHGAVVQKQLDAAYTTGCSCVVWPELTVPTSIKTMISKKMRQQGLTTNKRPRFVVAGTWHEKEGALTYNRGSVLDGFGRDILTFDKILPFRDGELGEEDIVNNRKLMILICDGLSIGFAICRDFAENRCFSPYSGLDIDLWVVPSLGGETTMDGHETTAKTVYDNYRSLVFVAQQARRPSPTVPGEVLYKEADRQTCPHRLSCVDPSPCDRKKRTRCRVLQHTTWDTYRLPLK